jgi:hypothetical protein
VTASEQAVKVRHVEDVKREQWLVARWGNSALVDGEVMSPTWRPQRYSYVNKIISSSSAVHDSVGRSDDLVPLTLTSVSPVVLPTLFPVLLFHYVGDHVARRI